MRAPQGMRVKLSLESSALSALEMSHRLFNPALLEAGLTPGKSLSPLSGLAYFVAIISSFETTSPEPSAQMRGRGNADSHFRLHAGQRKPPSVCAIALIGPLHQ